MKLYSYIAKDELIVEYNQNQDSCERYILVSEFLNELIIPKESNKKFFFRSPIKAYINDNIKKNPKDYYVLSTKFTIGTHGCYIEKNKLNQVINKLKLIEVEWVSPYYFSLELLEKKKCYNGRLYVNIGEYIYKIQMIEGNIFSNNTYLREGYYSKDMRKVDFFKKSIIWIEDDGYENT